MIYHSALLNNNPLLTLTVPLRGLLGGPICLERARSRSAPRPRVRPGARHVLRLLSLFSFLSLLLLLLRELPLLRFQVISLISAPLCLQFYSPFDAPSYSLEVAVSGVSTSL